MDCTHPKQESNMIGDRCGTCLTADQLEEQSKECGGEVGELLSKLAKLFRDGSVVYDRNGKTFSQWHDHFNETSLRLPN